MGRAAELCRGKLGASVRGYEWNEVELGEEGCGSVGGK